MVKISIDRDSLFSEQGKELLQKYYSNGKTPQHALAQTAETFSYGDDELAQFIYDACSKQHFFYSSPILSNAPSGSWDPNVDYKSPEFWKPENTEMRKKAWLGNPPKAMPIACFLSFVPDTIKGQQEAMNEIALLSVMGGGTSAHSSIRAISDKAPGPIPYFKVLDGVMGYYRQGKTRRGSCALYMNVDHPDIIEFIKIRTASGGDPARKITNRSSIHNGVNLTQTFCDAVEADTTYDVMCPHTKTVKAKLRAREVWETILEIRELTGEPYIIFLDVAREQLPECQKQLGLDLNGSNLCTEIYLATNKDRTAVCCLSSVNIAKYDEWKNTGLIGKLVRFLDNVLQWFIDWAPDSLTRAKYSAIRERAIGIGYMGWHTYLQSKMIPFEGGGVGSAVQHNYVISSLCYEEGINASKELAKERGEPEDMKGTGKRNSHIFAQAPNANSSILCDTSPSNEPIPSNAYTQKTRAGISLITNKQLKNILKTYNMDTEEIWYDIIAHNGSVQHLDFLSELEKNVFKTAWEIDQHWCVQHAHDRQPFVCQGQSLNLFFLPGSDRAYINSVHMKALRSGRIKSLYYFKTGSKQTADTVKTIERISIADWKENDTGDGICFSCQG